MSRKQFILSQGATCKNWTWSWSFINEKDKIIIFGAWDKETDGDKSMILDKAWEFHEDGRKSKGYPQSLEHIRLIEEEGYQLKTFMIQHGGEVGNEPARIIGFTPKLVSRNLIKIGSKWYATGTDSTDLLQDNIKDIIQNNTIQWTDAEYEEAVKAYLWMLEQEQSGKTYNKADVNNQLRQGILHARSKGSIEYRMQNISAVFQELCLPWIVGYKPAVNVGTEGKEKIKHYAAMHGGYSPTDYSPTANPNELEQKVQKVRKKITTAGIPSGQNKPQQTTSTSSSFVRDPLVKAWVLENAKGVCEDCGSPAPFLTIYDEPFLEVHHVKLLADGGSDTISNAIAVCPNCHRRCHLAKNKEVYISSIYSRIPRLVNE